MLDEIAFFIFIICIIVSIFFLYYSLNKPTSRKGLRRLIMKDWVKQNLDAQSKSSAIQAIRNQILVNGAFISALLILTGILVGLFQLIFDIETEFLWGLIPSFTIGYAQLSVILFCVFFSLINLINSSRMASNLSYLITSQPQDVEVNEIKGVDLTRDAFRISQRSWMLGVRGLFFIIAAVTWLVHSIFFIVSTLILTFYVILAQDIAIFEKKLLK